MPTVSAPGGVSLNVTDSGGSGRPVILIHGWPLSGASWSAQVPALVDAGYRVITYDRRGFGDSTPAPPYTYDTFAADLDAVLTDLDVTDATIVGFSMGGGEVARYLGTRGSERIRSAVLAAAIPPWLEKSEANPDGGLPREDLLGMQGQLRQDREGFLDTFLTNFFSANAELKVTEEQRQEALALTQKADLEAAAACMEAWLTDFTDDVASIDVPVLVIHGDADAIVPVEVSGNRSAELAPHGEIVVVNQGPHGINTSHPEEFNQALLGFLAR